MMGVIKRDVGLEVTPLVQGRSSHISYCSIETGSAKVKRAIMSSGNTRGKVAKG